LYKLWRGIGLEIGSLSAIFKSQTYERAAIPPSPSAHVVFSPNVFNRNFEIAMCSKIDTNIIRINSQVKLKTSQN
jgi:hypothetical protein